MNRLPFLYDDGGRKDAGYSGTAGDCVTRAVAIASRLPYSVCYVALSDLAGRERKSKGRTARHGIHTSRKWFRDYMLRLGFRWVPTMKIGQGCRVHLAPGELPMGRLVVSVSKHLTAVIDGVIHDTHDPQREQIIHWVDGRTTISRRCVYGYWTLDPARLQFAAPSKESKR